MSGMELRHLRYFVAVAEELHFGRAAKRLHIAQPPLSAQIRQLEREIGAELLARTTRQVTLTDAGEQLLAYARQALREADLGVDAARRAARGELGTLRVGFVDSAAYNLLPRVLLALRDERPGISIDLREATTAEQLSALGDDLDVGIVREATPTAAIRLEALVHEPLLAALPQDHRLAGRETIELGDLADDPFVLFPRTRVANVYDHLVARCRAAGFSPQLSQEALQYPTILGLVWAGFGVAVVPASVQDSVGQGVAFARLTDDDATSTLSLAVPSGDDSPLVAAFRSVALAAAAGLSEVPAASARLFR